MPLSKLTVSHILGRKLGQANDSAGSVIELSFDTPRKCTRGNVLKPKAPFDLLVDPVSTGVKNIGNAPKEIRDRWEERAKIASAMKEVGVLPHVPYHCSHRQSILDGPDASRPIGSMLPANAAQCHAGVEPIEDLFLYRFALERENSTPPPH
jgi:hypothetical protein